MISEAVKANYTRLWGEPSREMHFRRENYHVIVYKWDISVNPRGAHTYATCGLSEYPIPEYHATHRFELFTDFIPARDEIADTLACIGLIPYLHHRHIGNGHTVTYDEPLWPDTEMHSVFLSTAEPETIGAFASEQDIHVEFLQVIPIYLSELQFKKDHSLDDLLRHWYEHTIHYENPNHPPCPP